MFALKDIIKKKIFNLLDLFILIGCKINSPTLVSWILFLAARRSKLILNSASHKECILVLDKSFGGDDLSEAFKKKYCPYKIYILQRRYLRTIFDYYFQDYLKKIDESNYDNLEESLTAKIKYRKFLLIVFKKIKKILNLRTIISFNIFYITERELQYAAKNLNLKFIVHMKESIHWGQKKLTNLVHWKKYFRPMPLTNVSVYNKYSKELISNGKLINKNKIKIVGMPRTDYYFNLRKKTKNNYILFLMIERTAGLPYYSNKWYEKGSKKFNWKKLSLRTTKLILDVAKENKNTKFIFKTKPNESLEELKIVKKYNLKNCSIIQGGTSNILIGNSKAIIAFNTTGIFEGLILNKNLIIPKFKDYTIQTYKKYCPNLSGMVFEPNNEFKMKKILNNIINNNLNFKINSSKKNKLLKEHFNSIKGKSGEELRKFLIKHI